MVEILNKIIETNRLHLIQLDLEFLETSLVSESNAVEFVDYKLSPYWFKEKSLISTRISQIIHHPSLSSWLLRAIVRRTDNQMIGHFNAHGKPGMAHLISYCRDGLEIGYTIYKPYRRMGFASEALSGFIESIPKPVSVVLSIEENNKPSLKMAEKLKFEQVERIVDEGEVEIVHLRRFI